MHCVEQPVGWNVPVTNAFSLVPIAAPVTLGSAYPFTRPLQATSPLELSFSLATVKTSSPEELARTVSVMCGDETLILVLCCTPMSTSPLFNSDIVFRLAEPEVSGSTTTAHR